MSFDWNDKIQKLSAEIDNVREKRRPQAADRKHVKFNLPD
jgi:hypothetical protein